MLSLLICLTILILKTEARPPENDLPRHQYLTHGHIYNNTHLEMLQSFLWSYNLAKSLRDSYNDSKVNEVEDQPLYNDSSNPLLVGFAGYPFSYSVSEDDYIKGMRNMELQMYKNKTGNRDKRSLTNLYNMISCATDCNPLDYNGYGCYCGLGGKGIATDAIDSCCQAHDECYHNINRIGRLQPYFWKCNNGMPRCGFANEFLIGSASKLCECDRKFAMCLRKQCCPKGRPVCSSSPARQEENEFVVALMELISVDYDCE